MRNLTETDRAVWDATGYGASGPWPRRPALLVIDVTRDFCGPQGASAVEAARAVRTACGPAAWAAIPAIAGLIGAARAADVPVVYTRRSDERLATRRRKSARSAEDDPKGNRIAAPLAPAPGEAVIGKSGPSAFWRTGLEALLQAGGHDGVILCGCTTSGCVRATAVDAYSRGLSVIVAADGVFDRFEASHLQSLFDLSAKYADVLTAADIVRRLAAGRPGHHAENPAASKSTPR